MLDSTPAVTCSTAWERVESAQDAGEDAGRRVLIGPGVQEAAHCETLPRAHSLESPKNNSPRPAARGDRFCACASQFLRPRAGGTYFPVPITHKACIWACSLVCCPYAIRRASDQPRALACNRLLRCSCWRAEGPLASLGLTQDSLGDQTLARGAKPVPRWL
jgi:hypothetical protein